MLINLHHRLHQEMIHQLIHRDFGENIVVKLDNQQ